MHNSIIGIGFLLLGLIVGFVCGHLWYSQIMADIKKAVADLHSKVDSDLSELKAKIEKALNK